ncbi:MAG: pentapeptide repeat-containing protein, partial [Thermoprotei archaeon]
FKQCNLQNSTFHNCNLARADFSGAREYSFSPVNNKIRDAKFNFPEVVELLRFFQIKIKY